MSETIQRSALICLCIAFLIGVYVHYYNFESNTTDEKQKCSITSDCSNGKSCVKESCLDETEKTLFVCQLIKEKSSSTKVLYPSDDGYDQSISHYAISSTQRSVCSVLPSTADDVAIILKIIGEYRVEFAIKCGGHSLNPGFSSTKGVHISMSRFHHVFYHENNGTVDIGGGMIWDDVFEKLEPYNISVVGGRISGVGVGGLLLGGGYSWKSNQYGLSIDNIYGYELVTPDGEIVYVNKESYPDIFFGLKGGFNNFGIVTKFNVRAIPQTAVYAGILHYPPSEFDHVIKAIENFQENNKDPKGELVAFLMGKRDAVKIVVNLFYDAPTDSNGVFNEFLSIRHIGEVKTQSFLSFIKSTYFTAVHNKRGRLTTVSVEKITARFIYGLINQFQYLNSTLGSKQGAAFFFTIEPYVSTFLNNAQESAYPHSSSIPILPLLIAFIWDLPADDQFFVEEIKSTYKNVFQIAIDDKQNVHPTKQIHYPNYASEHLSLSQLYGENLSRLQKIRKSWDKNNVMYLTGGYKF